MDHPRLHGCRSLLTPRAAHYPVHPPHERRRRPRMCTPVFEAMRRGGASSRDERSSPAECHLSYRSPSVGDPQACVLIRRDRNQPRGNCRIEPGIPRVGRVALSAPVDGRRRSDAGRSSVSPASMAAIRRRP